MVVEATWFLGSDYDSNSTPCAMVVPEFIGSNKKGKGDPSFNLLILIKK